MEIGVVHALLDDMTAGQRALPNVELLLAARAAREDALDVLELLARNRDGRATAHRDSEPYADMGDCAPSAEQRTRMRTLQVGGTQPMSANEGERMRQVNVGGRWVTTSEVIRSYWKFAAERQHVYHARLAGLHGPWTDDPVISRFRFTNAYRAADRVSQDLIRVAYAGSQNPKDVLLRVLLFRFFNKPSTWRMLEGAFGEISQESFDIDAYSAVLDRMLSRGERVYSAAYILPPPPFGAARKHRNHLLLIDHMMKSGLAARISDAPSLKVVFDSIASYPSLGPFLAYQLTVDLNYTTIIDFEENDFVVPGPGARSGISKCFLDLDGLAPEDVIRWMVDTQDEQFAELGLSFENLFGRSLTLIDCQNLFCETDKYARVMHPDAQGLGNRTRIKQQFAPLGIPDVPFFPPKWGINQNIGMKAREPEPLLF